MNDRNNAPFWDWASSLKKWKKTHLCLKKKKEIVKIEISIVETQVLKFSVLNLHNFNCKIPPHH